MIDTKLVSELRKITGAGILDCKKALEETNGDLDKAVNFLREKGIATANKKAERIAAEGLANIFVDGNKAVILEINSETDFVSKNEEFIEMFDKIGNVILESDVTEMEDALKLNCGEGTIEDYIISKTAKIGEKLSFRRFEVITKNDNEVFGNYLHMGGKIAVLSLLEGADEETAKDVSMQAAAMKPLYITKEDVPADVVDNEKAILKEEAINEGKPAEIAEKIVMGRINKFFQEICLLEQTFIKDGDLSVGAFDKKAEGKVLNFIRFEVGEGLEKRDENFAEEVMSQMK